MNASKAAAIILVLFLVGQFQVAVADTNVGDMLEYCEGAEPDSNNPILGQNYCFYYIEGFVSAALISQSITHSDEICFPDGIKIRAITRLFLDQATPPDKDTPTALYLYLLLSDQFPC